MANASAAPRRSAKVLVWALVLAVGLAAFVQTTGLGIDLLLLAAGIFLLLAVERTVGDFVAEWFGPFSAAAIFAIVTIAVSWYFLSSALGRSQTDRFFVEAERRGYRAVYYKTPRQSSAGQSASTGTSGGSASGAAAASTDASKDEGRGEPERRSRRDKDVPKAREKGNDDASKPAGRSGRDGAVSAATRWTRSVLGRRASARDPHPTTISVRISPPKVEAPRRATITATVTAGSERVTFGTVEFTVNGLGAGRRELDEEGVATTTFATHIAGTYEVRARFVGTPEHATSLSGPAHFDVIVR